jgi:hypothetical protein
VGLAALTIVVAASAGGKRAAAVPTPAFSVEELTAMPGDNWVGWNGNLYNQRHSTLNQITSANARNLRVASGPARHVRGGPARRLRRHALHGRLHEQHLGDQR